ncbi:MAG: hypothetical protein CMH22_05795 [Methylophaga sp.]|nr:hypothetical protein [Methylophaga sp.]|tara:strand:+ start:86645 stop:86950 length:306 start_codon:yes stop_codon:yes gene_type:complete
MFKYTDIVSDCDTYHLSANINEKEEFYMPGLAFYEEGVCGDIWDNGEYLLNELYPFLKNEVANKELSSIFTTEEIKVELVEMFDEAIRIGMFKNTKIYDTV